MNKKLTKLLSIFLLAGLIGTGTALGVAGCKNKNNNGGNNTDQTQPGGDDDGGDDDGGEEGSSEFTIEFDLDGHGTAIDSATTASGKLSVIPEPEDSDYTFDGWYLPDGTTKVDGDTVFTSNTVIKAKWIKNEVTSIVISTSRDKLYDGGDLNKATLTAVVTGTGTYSEEVTWAITAGETLATLEDNELTATAAGTVKVQATSVMGSVKSEEIEITITAIPPIPQEESDRAVVPVYTGPAAGPVAGIFTKVDTFNASELKTGVLEEGWTDGTYKLIKGEIRTRTNRTNVYDPEDSSKILETGVELTQSFKLGSADDQLQLEVPEGGKLTVYLENGSSGSAAAYKVKLPATPVQNKVFNLANGYIVKEEYVFDRAGIVSISRNSGTVDIYKVVFECNVSAAPIQSITVTDAGTSDYLLTQKLNCEGVKVIAKDSNGTNHEAPISSLKFDTSKYNPNFPGEYEIGVTYTLDSNLESEQTEFETTYKVRVFGVNSIWLATTKMVSNTQRALLQACTPGTDFSADNLTVYGVCQLGAETIERRLQNDWYTISTPDLTTAGKKTVTVKVASDFVFEDADVSATYEIVVKEKPAAINNQVTFTVGENGDFSSITQAVQFIEACEYADSVNKIIKVDAGVYEEKVWIYANNVTLVGMGEKAGDTVLTWSAVESTTDPATGTAYGLRCATLQVDGKDFKAYNIDIRNDFDYCNEYLKYASPQGLALTINGDGAVIYNCHLYGNQDTLYLKNGRTYFYKTEIEGNIDFIFGEATGLAFFDECKIVAICGKKSGGDQNGYVTAMKATDGDKPDYGYIFNKCVFTSDNKNGVVAEGSMSLGRTWGAKATVTYINCDFSDVYSVKGYGDSSVKTHRWESMNGSPVGADFSEYGSTGDGAISTAVTGGKILTKEEADACTKENIFAAKNGKCSWSAAWNCDTALDGLIAVVDPSACATVTVKDTEGNTLTEFSVKKGGTVTADTIKAAINPSLAGDEKEVDKIYSAYTDLATNTEYAEAAIDEDLELTVSIKDIEFEEKVYTLLELIPNKITYSSEPIAIHKEDLHLTAGSLNPNDNSGCCIAVPGTKITLDLVGEVSIVWYDGGTDEYGKDADAEIVYKNGKATITLGSRIDQFYIKQIKIDLTVTPDDTPEAATYNITFSLNGAEGTAPATQTISDGKSATAPFVPVWAGYKFLGWYTDATEGDKYAFGAVTEEVNLYAHWEAVTEPVVIEENSTIGFGSAGNFQEFIASTALIGTTVNASTYRNNGGNLSQLSDTFSIKVRQGAVITITSYKDGLTSYTVNASGATATKQTGTSYEFTVAANDEEQDFATVTFACDAQNYFYSIKVTYSQPKITQTTTIDLTSDYANAAGMECVKFTSGQFTDNGGKVYINNGTVIEIAVEGNPEVSFLWFDSVGQPKYGTDANASINKSVSGKIIITFTQGTAEGDPGFEGLFLKSITLTYAE